MIITRDKSHKLWSQLRPASGNNTSINALNICAEFSVQKGHEGSRSRHDQLFSSFLLKYPPPRETLHSALDSARSSRRDYRDYCLHRRYIREIQIAQLFASERSRLHGRVKRIARLGRAITHRLTLVECSFKAITVKKWRKFVAVVLVSPPATLSFSILVGAFAVRLSTLRRLRTRPSLGRATRRSRARATFTRPRENSS